MSLFRLCVGLIFQIKKHSFCSTFSFNFLTQFSTYSFRPSRFSRRQPAAGAGTPSTHTVWQEDTHKKHAHYKTHTHQAFEHKLSLVRTDCESVTHSHLYRGNQHTHIVVSLYFPPIQTHWQTHKHRFLTNFWNPHSPWLCTQPRVALSAITILFPWKSSQQKSSLADTQKFT